MKLLIFIIAFFFTTLSYAEFENDSTVLWEGQDEEKIAGDMLGFTPKDTLDEIPEAWPEWAYKRFVMLDEKVQKLLEDKATRKERQRIEDVPYSTIKQPENAVFAIDSLKMSEEDRRQRDLWDSELIALDRKSGSRYLYMTVPKFKYWTKMVVSSGDATIVQDYEGHGAITEFDETKLFRVDVFDAEGYIGSGFNRPVAKWVRIISDHNIGLSGIELWGVEVLQDLGDNYIIRVDGYINQASENSVIAYIKNDGEILWHQAYTQDHNSSTYTGNKTIIDDNYDITATFFINSSPSSGETNKFKIKDGVERWSYTANWCSTSIGQLQDGGYVIDSASSTVLAPNNIRLTRLNSAGTKVNWGNGSSTIIMTEEPATLVVDDDGYIYHAGHANIQKYDGRTGATQGNWIWDYAHGYDVARDVCIGQDGSINVLVVEVTNETRIISLSPSKSVYFDKEIVSGSGYSLYSISLCNDGGYICGGTYGASPYPDREMCMVKVNQNGDVDWINYFTDGSGVAIVGRDAVQTNDGGYLAIGTHDWYTNNDSVYLVKTNQYGETCSAGEPCEGG